MGGFPDPRAVRMMTEAARAHLVGWRLIDTAPRQEDAYTWAAPNILVARSGSEPAVAQWCNGRWCASANGSPVWEGGDRGGLADLEFTPTHWMLLPEPPQ